MRTTISQERKARQQEVEKLFTSIRSSLFKTARSVTANLQDAEDILQTVFMRLVRGRRLSVNFHQNPKGYLHRAVTNQALSLRRNRDRRREADDSLDDLEIAAPSSSDDAYSEYRVLLRGAISKLKPEMANLLDLHLAGYSRDEIAKTLGGRQSSIAMRISRANDKIRKVLEADGVKIAQKKKA